MKKLRRLMLILGFLLLAIVLIVTPFMLLQTITIESVASLDTPFEIIAHAYCEWMILDKMWIWFAVSGVLLTIVAFVIRHIEKKK